MKKRYKIIKFINEHKNWRQILTSEPYNLKVKEDDNYILLKYNQLFSDLTNPLVQEARGIIIKKEKGKYKPVCLPFTKFFALRDPNAKNAIYKLCHQKKWLLEQKIDGSLIKLWYDNNKWHVSTNGSIDAYKAEITLKVNDINTYGQMFDLASKNKIDYTLLDKNFTYMFELVGLENKVVVPYEKEDIYYLGKRNNYSFIETSYYEDDCRGVEGCKRPQCSIIEVKSPKKDLNYIQNMTDNLTKDDENFEGFVVSDINLKSRIKVKSKEYMELFAIKGNGVFTNKKILLLILDSKDDDVISSFPEFKNQFDSVRRALCIWLEKVKKDLKYLDCHTWENQRDFAEWAKNTTCSSIIFAAKKTGNHWQDGWLENQVKNIRLENLLKNIGMEDNNDIREV